MPFTFSPQIQPYTISGKWFWFPCWKTVCEIVLHKDIFPRWGSPEWFTLFLPTFPLCLGRPHCTTCLPLSLSLSPLHPYLRPVFNLILPLEVFPHPSACTSLITSFIHLLRDQTSKSHSVQSMCDHPSEPRRCFLPYLDGPRFCLQCSGYHFAIPNFPRREKKKSNTCFWFSEICK